jgi:hypothetical protein
MVLREWSFLSKKSSAGEVYDDEEEDDFDGDDFDRDEEGDETVYG